MQFAFIGGSFKDDHGLSTPHKGVAGAHAHSMAKVVASGKFNFVAEGLLGIAELRGCGEEMVCQIKG